MEQWKDVLGYEGVYQISNLGNVKRLSTVLHDRFYKEKLLTICHNSGTGYDFVCLRKNNRDKNFSVHRLVAQAFIPNPRNLSDVNHIDGNKRNNSVENLEWCTRSENLKHALDIGLIENQCKICRKVTIKCEEKIVVFDTMKDCATFFGFQKGWLQNQIRRHGLTFTYGKYEINVSERRGADRNVKFL